MNDSHDHLMDGLLGRLLDEAAASYEPLPDPARLQRLVSPGRRRGAVMLFSAAACLAFMGGAALAIHNDGEPEQRLTPGGELSDRTTTTGHKEEADEPLHPDEGELDPPKATEPKPTEPDGWDEPRPTEPKPTEPTEPKPTEPTAPKPTEPKPTEPTAPKPTEPTEPKPTEPTEPEPVWPWSANQAYGQGSDSPPFDVFYGTAAPGAKIVIEAKWGRVVGYANEEGQWELHITFPESPIGEPFKVWVVSGDHTELFWFTHTAAD